MSESENDFRSLFGRRPDVVASAPGRVNLIGEHTDYNEGFVLPTAIPQRTTVEIARRSGSLVRVWSASLAEAAPATFNIGSEQAGQGWVDYVAGVTHALSDMGYMATGFDARIESDVPLGSGLSSSAALEVALLRALRDAFAFGFDDVELARVAHLAETHFVGAPVGVMDQMACSLAEPGVALFLDTALFRFERVPLPPGVELLVVDSRIAHRHADGDYRTRRAECEAASRALGVKSLRDVPLHRVETLPAPLDRRARHVVTENARVLQAVRAMRAGNAEAVGRLFVRSHESMRDDYEVSIPEIDLLVETALDDSDVFGARLTGGGFGGSIVALVRQGEGARAGARLATRYRQRTGRHVSVLVPLLLPVDGGLFETERGQRIVDLDPTQGEDRPG